MDVRKVQSIVKEIYAGGSIKVNITEDLDSIENSDKIIAIGSEKTISYQFQTSSEMMINYFDIIEESNKQLLKLINKMNISKTQWFPIFAFSNICNEIEASETLKEQQITKISNYIETINLQCESEHTLIQDILNDDSITHTNKLNAIFWSIFNKKVTLEDAKHFMITMESKTKSTTQYRRILCLYDFMKYS